MLWRACAMCVCAHAYSGLRVVICAWRVRMHAYGGVTPSPSQRHQATLAKDVVPPSTSHPSPWRPPPLPPSNPVGSGGTGTTAAASSAAPSHGGGGGGAGTVVLVLLLLVVAGGAAIYVRRIGGMPLPSLLQPSRARLAKSRHRSTRDNYEQEMLAGECLFQPMLTSPLSSACPVTAPLERPDPQAQSMGFIPPTMGASRGAAPIFGAEDGSIAPLVTPSQPP